MTKNIHISGHGFVLDPSAAAFWEQTGALLISDVHLGKVSHFRRHGVAVPENSISRNFERLSEIIRRYDPKSVIFLGDLFHSKKNREWDLFARWLQDAQREMVLIAGNHDIIEPAHYESLGVKVVSEIAAGDLLLTHHPERREGFFNICGHIHPAVELRGLGRQYMKLPCFFKKTNQLILPAFGEFTGTYVLAPEENDCVYAIANDQIVTVCGD